jgi:hypothetical protein
LPGCKTQTFKSSVPTRALTGFDALRPGHMRTHWRKQPVSLDPQLRRHVHVFSPVSVLLSSVLRPVCSGYLPPSSCSLGNLNAAQRNQAAWTERSALECAERSVALRALAAG